MMKKLFAFLRMAAVICTLLIPVILSSCKKDEPEPEPVYAIIKGRVINQDRLPVPGAFVTINSETFETDAVGQFFFYELLPGPADLEVIAVGHESLSLSIDLVEGENDDLELVMQVSEILIDVPAKEYNIDFEATAIRLDISSNSTWDLRSESSWIKLSKSFGLGNDTVYLYADTNLGLESRQASLRLTSKGKSVEITINQHFPLKVISTQAFLGNDLEGETCEFRIKFNKDVSGIEKTVVSDARGLIQPYVKEVSLSSPDEVVVLCTAGICSDTVISMDVVNTFTTKEKVVADVHFYSKKLLLEDCNISQWDLFNDGKEFLMSTEENRMMRVDAGTGDVIKAFDFAGHVRFYISRYDGKCYVMEQGNNKLLTLDLETGDIASVYEFEESEDNRGLVYPSMMGVLADGTGIIVLKSLNGYYSRWLYIDFREGNISTKAEMRESSAILGITVNHDASKLYLSGATGLIYIYESGKPFQFREVLNPHTNRISRIYASLSEDRVIVRQYNEQFVMDGNGNCSGSVAAGNDHEDGCAFCYDKGMEDIVYICETGYNFIDKNVFFIVDMGAATPRLVASSSICGTSNGFFTDLNGKAYCYDSHSFPDCTAIYIFETEQFNGMLRDRDQST